MPRRSKASHADRFGYSAERRRGIAGISHPTGNSTKNNSGYLEDTPPRAPVTPGSPQPTLISLGLRSDPVLIWGNRSAGPVGAVVPETLLERVAPHLALRCSGVPFWSRTRSANPSIQVTAIWAFADQRPPLLSFQTIFSVPLCSALIRNAR